MISAIEESFSISPNEVEKITGFGFVLQADKNKTSKIGNIRLNI